MYLLPINQRDLERVLNERAAELGAEVRRGWDVLSFSQTDDQVDVVARGSDGTETTFTARYQPSPAGSARAGSPYVDEPTTRASGQLNFPREGAGAPSRGRARYSGARRTEC